MLAALTLSQALLFQALCLSLFEGQCVYLGSGLSKRLSSRWLDLHCLIIAAGSVSDHPSSFMWIGCMISDHVSSHMCCTEVYTNDEGNDQGRQCYNKVGRQGLVEGGSSTATDQYWHLLSKSIGISHLNACWNMKRLHRKMERSLVVTGRGTLLCFSVLMHGFLLRTGRTNLNSASTQCTTYNVPLKIYQLQRTPYNAQPTTYQVHCPKYNMLSTSTTNVASRPKQLATHIVPHTM
jgi:hypothetical protein